MYRTVLFGAAVIALPLCMGLGGMGLGVCFAEDEPKPLRLSVSLAPDEDPVKDIRMPLALDAGEGTRQIFVRNADATVKESLPSVRLYLQLHDDRQIPIGTATLLPGTAEKPELIVPGAGRSTLVQLNVKGIDQYGEFVGTLIATFDAQAVKLAEVKVQRTPKPKLELLDAPAGDGAIVLKTDTPLLARSIRVRAADDAEVKIRSIAILPFVATNASLVNVKDLVMTDENGENFDISQPLAAGKSVAIDFSARFEEVANYSGVLRIEYQGGTLQKGIQVTRERPKPEYEILGVENVYGTRSWRNAPINWRFAVQETGGKPRDLNIPRLINFGLDEEVLKGQTDYEQRILLDVDTPLMKPWELPAGEIKPLTLEISGLKSSGKYTGMVQVGQADGQSKAATIHLLVKESWLVPCICIGVGVIISCFLRLAVNRWQPQLSRLKRAGEINEQLTRVEKAAEPADAEEKSVLDSLRARWNTMYRQIEESKFTEADAVDAELGRKLTVFPEWLNTYRRWKAVEPAAIVEGLQVRLEAVQNFLRGESADAAATVAQQNELKKIDTEITQAIAAHLQKSLDEFKKQVEARRNSPSTPADDRTRLDESVLLYFKPAKEALKKGNRTDYNREFALARGQYVLFLADDLSARLAASQRPIGFQAADKQADWSKLAKDVTALLAPARQYAANDPDLAAQHYQAAYTTYLTALLEGAKEVVKATDELIKANAARLGDKKDGYLQRVVDWGNKLYDAERSLQDGELQSAFELYQAAAGGLIALAAELKPIGQVQMGLLKGQPVDLQAATDAAPGQSVTGPAAEGTARLVPQFWVSPRLSIKQIKRLRCWLEIVLAIAAGVIAVLLGLKLLWASDPTWGSPDDFLTAVLWGLGLHQVSGAAIGSSQGLLDKFVTPTEVKK